MTSDAVDQYSVPPAAAAGRVRPLLAATGVSVTGDGAFMAAAPLLAVTLTRSPLAISTVTAATYLPWLVAGLPAGALVDRWPRRRVMISADLIRAAVLGLLAVLVLTHHAQMVVLVVTILVVGVAQCFFDSATQAVIPALVGRDKETLTRVNGRYWSIDSAGRALVGPPLGSGVFALAAMLPFALDAVSFLGSAAFVSRLPRVAPQGGEHEPLGAAILAGLRHLFRTGELRALAFAMASYNFAYNVGMATFVLYAVDDLGVGARGAGYGALLAAAAIGGIATGWRASALTRRMTHRQTMAMASLVQGVAWAGIAVIPNVFTAAVFLALIGSAFTLTSVAVGSARQSLTPDALLGRVVSAFRLFGIGAAGLGALAGGTAATFATLHAPLWVAAVLAVAVAVALRPWQGRLQAPPR